MNRARPVHVMVPEGVQDPLRPSGGNTYDRRLCQELAAAGWSVQPRVVSGAWPWAEDVARRSLGEAIGDLPTGSPVLVDGLVASAFPEVLVPAARRLRLVVLMHMPLGRRSASDRAHQRESAVLCSAAAVVTTSEWCRGWLLATYGLDPARVHVAQPGVDAAERAVGSGHGGNLVCVGVVTPGKGHDVLLEALARVQDLTWRCLCVGTLTREPGFVTELRRGIGAAGLEDRLVLAGPRTGRDLAASYAAADALVLATRGETYGMVVTEALARALPVIAPDVGGVPEALGVTPDGRRPGLLVPPGDVAALACALRRWLADPDLRSGLREAAGQRRAGLTGWSETADRVSRVLAEVTT